MHDPKFSDGAWLLAVCCAVAAAVLHGGSRTYNTLVFFAVFTGLLSIHWAIYSRD